VLVCKRLELTPDLIPGIERLERLELLRLEKLLPVGVVAKDRLALIPP
jgi:hypothetical protein